jgi:hypothetical protein
MENHQEETLGQQETWQEQTVVPLPTLKDQRWEVVPAM